MNFANPSALWLFAIGPLLIMFFLLTFSRHRAALERFVSAPLVAQLAGTTSWTARRWKAALVIGCALAGSVALARPRWGFEWREVKHRGVDVFVLLDVSKSMLAEDVRPNRLTQAKFAVKDLLQHLAGDRVGLIAFAGTAFVQCPLTVDREAFQLSLHDADPAMIPRGGSAIGQAIETAVKAFAAGEARDRAIVLITDGEDTEGDPLAAADQAAAAGVRVYAIGVGTSAGELIPIRREQENVEFLKDQAGQVVKSRLNDETLKQVALKTGGIYVRSAAGDFGIDTIYDQGIRQLQRHDYEARLQKHYFERFQWPLGIATALLVMELFVSDRRREARQ